MAGEIIEAVDFYIIPSANPDGYHHTWTKVSCEYWQNLNSKILHWGIHPQPCPDAIGEGPKQNKFYSYSVEDQKKKKMSSQQTGSIFARNFEI